MFLASLFLLGFLRVRVQRLLRWKTPTLKTMEEDPIHSFKGMNYIKA